MRIPDPKAGGLFKGAEARKMQSNILRVVTLPRKGVSLTTRGTIFSPQELKNKKNKKRSFYVSIVGKNATVRTGLILFQSSNEIIAEDTIALDGSTEYIYVYEYKDHSARGIAHSYTEPVSDSTRWAWPLVQLTASTSGKTYKIEQIHHEGDIPAQWILK